MATMLKSSAEYNWRAAIIKGLHIRRSATEIIRFFGYSRLTVYNSKIYGFRTVQRRFRYASEEESLEKTHREKPRSRWKNSSADSGQSLRVDECNEVVDGNCGFRKAICFSVERYTDSYESLDSKLALRQRRYVLVQGILASQHPRFKSLGLLCMERNRKGHKQVPTSQCDVIKDRYWGSIRRHYNVRANASDWEAVIQANGGYYISNNCAL